jgi:peptidoglycan/LPS O-acetylase OafA/YrhL
MLRGLASCFVACAHLRSFVFENFGSLKEPGWIVKIFYALTSLGHASVIVFFAMSGFLVGGKALVDMTTDRWSWPRYLLRRSTRLLIVVVPALLATLVLDSIGIRLTGNAGYDGSLYQLYSSGPSLDQPPSYSVWTFLGNLAFLQTVYVPIFGSNSPMWSLANEFWYYIVFPLAATIFFFRHDVVRGAISIVILIALVFFLPWPLLEGGLIWVAGAAAAWVTRIPSWARAYRHIGMRVLAFALVLLALAVTRKPFAHSDLVLGLCVAFMLPVLAWLPSFGRLYQSSAQAVAEVSYTLYLTHFPLLTLLVFVNFAPYRFQPGLQGALVYCGLLAVTVTWAVAFWWCFERHTDRVFGYLARRLQLDRPAVQPVAATKSPS